MAEICPTITATNLAQFNAQQQRAAGLAQRLHIDLMDGDFAPTESPRLADVKPLPHKINDIHLMYRRPMDYLPQLTKLRPQLVIIHAEAEVDHMHFAAELHRRGIKAGLALLQDTTVTSVEPIIDSFGHILIFSGHLGYHGGQADLANLTKVAQVKRLNPTAEIAWDGGINDQNARALVDAGVDVLNVGGFIQKSPDPAAAYQQIANVIGV